MRHLESITPTHPIHRNAVSAHHIPELKGLALSYTDAELRHFFMQQMVLLKAEENLKSFSNRVFKKTMDILFSLLALPVLLLSIGFIGIAIRLDSAGPVFLVQKRMGKNKKLFKCLKFRTMYVNADAILEDYLPKNRKAADEWTRYKKLRDYDPRVTRIGKFLRTTSLDELPQIFNVLKGEMSLFGPRPYLPEEERDMKGYCDMILMTPPGVTGLWQVSGRNGLTFQDRLKLDAFYVANWSPWLDIEIFFKTVRVVLKREGAY